MAATYRSVLALSSTSRSPRGGGAEGIERVAVHAALEQRATNCDRPGIEFGAARAAERAPDQRGLEPPRSSAG